MTEFTCNREYRRLNFAKEFICLLDPEHIAMDSLELKKYILKNIAEIKKQDLDNDMKIAKNKVLVSYWAKYYQAVVYARDQCPYLDRNGLKDKKLLTCYIPDDINDTYELIPDSCMGSKCKCLFPRKYD